MRKDAKILVTGTSGMVGKTLVDIMKNKSYTRVLEPTHSCLDLLDSDSVNEYFNIHNPEYVFMIAARVGGISANIKNPVEFLSDNLQMQINLFKACHTHRIEKSLFLGSSCIYPRLCEQPMKEEYLLTGPLEPTNEGYAIAKIAGLKLAEYYHKQHGMMTICPMPCNIYGTNDHYNLERSHVLSALVMRFVDARDENKKNVTLWGTGSAKREFIHSVDVAKSMIFLMNNYNSTDIVNVGTGTDITIRNLANLIRNSVGFKGDILWDESKPDGMPRKCLDTTKLSSLGFAPQISLEDGITRTISEYTAIKSKRLST